MKHFIPVALDTYFRGNSQELEFCKKVRAGGNHLVVATAGGLTLGNGRNLRMRQKELAAVLAEYQKLTTDQRKPKLPDPKDALPPRRKVPNAPKGGVVVRGYCTYLRQDETGKIVRSKEYYYKENPDRWAAETQSDMLWLTEQEWKSLIPANAKAGDEISVPAPIQKRFFSTIGIDYMEGSVNSSPPRKLTMALTVKTVSADAVLLQLDGYGRLGKDFDKDLRGKPDTRGCEIRVLGFLSYNVPKKALDRFDVVGIGKAWGKKRHDNREVRIDDYPWTYGIACELVTGDSPMDRIPPYNLLHYGSAGPYFSSK